MTRVEVKTETVIQVVNELSIYKHTVTLNTLEASTESIWTNGGHLQTLVKDFSYLHSRTHSYHHSPE